MSEGLFYFFALTISPPLRFGSALCPVAEEALGRQVSEHRRDGSATIQAPRRRRRAPRVQRRSAGSPDACVTSCSCLPGEPTPSSIWAYRTSTSHRPCGAGIDRRSHTCIAVAEIVELPRFIGSDSRTHFVLIDEYFDGAQIPAEVTCVRIRLHQLRRPDLCVPLRRGRHPVPEPLLQLEQTHRLLRIEQLSSDSRPC